MSTGPIYLSHLISLAAYFVTQNFAQLISDYSALLQLTVAAYQSAADSLSRLDTAILHASRTRDLLRNANFRTKHIPETVRMIILGDTDHYHPITFLHMSDTITSLRY